MLREDEVLFCLTKEAIRDGTEVLLGNGETVRFANCEGYLSNLRSGFATLVGERFTSGQSLDTRRLSKRYQKNRGEEILPHNFVVLAAELKAEPNRLETIRLCSLSTF